MGEKASFDLEGAGGAGDLPEPRQNRNSDLHQASSAISPYLSRSSSSVLLLTFNSLITCTFLLSLNPLLSFSSSSFL